MGRWGMGISSSDVCADVKDEFFTLYYKGVAVKDIEKAIMDYYKAEECYADENDGIWHDVYFALCDCEWSCDKLSSWILEKVEKVIATGAAVEYFKELAAQERDLKQWSKNLQKFLERLKNVNPKPLLQKIKKPYVPLLEAGDVFVWKVGTVYRAGIVLYRYGHSGERDKWCFDYCIAISVLQSDIILTVEEIVNAKAYKTAWYAAWNGMLTKKQIQKIGNIKGEIKNNYRSSFGATISNKVYSVKHCGIEDFMGEMIVEDSKEMTTIKQLF